MKMNCAKFGSVWEEVKHIRVYRWTVVIRKKLTWTLGSDELKMQRRSGLLVLELHLDKPFKVAKNDKRQSQTKHRHPIVLRHK